MDLNSLFNKVNTKNKKRTRKELEKKKEKEKLALGGNPINVKTPSEISNEVRLMAEQASAEASTKGDTLRAFGGLLNNLGMSMASDAVSKIGDTKGFTKFIQDNFSAIKSINNLGLGFNSAAFGGTSDTLVNAEGGEVVEDSSGNVFELKGNSHENGGVDIFANTVFSKRLKGEDGKTMAQRKIDREKKESKLRKLASKNPNDKLLQKSLERTIQTNKIENDSDVSKMNFVRLFTGETISSDEDKPVMALGGVPTKKPTLFDLYEDVSPFLKYDFGDRIDASLGVGLKDYTLPKPKNPTLDLSPLYQLKEKLDSRPLEGREIQPITGEDISEEGNGGFNLKDIIGDTTFGDVLGLVGTGINTFGPYRNTQKNRAGDTANINHYKNYGESALQSIDESKNFINSMLESQINDLEMSKNSSKNSVRNSARSINTLRALENMVDSSTDKARTGVYNSFTNQMMNILNSEAQTKLNIDGTRMKGESERDLADRHDRDNYFTQLGRDIATMGTGLQHGAKHINNMKERTVQGRLLNSLYNNFQADITSGKITPKALEETVFKFPNLFENMDKNKITEVANKLYKNEYKIDENNKIVRVSDNKEISLTTGKPIN